MREVAFETIITGQITGAVNAERLPDIAAAVVKIKANATNDGNMYIGAEGVTTSTGYQLDAGEETDWIPLGNLNKLYQVADDATQTATYIILR